MKIKAEKLEELFSEFWSKPIAITPSPDPYYYRNKVDGLIHVTAFGCGPDAMVGKLIELEAKTSGEIPYLKILVDEHTGDAGLMTRIEAFTDMSEYEENSEMEIFDIDTIDELKIDVEKYINHKVCELGI